MRLGLKTLFLSALFLLGINSAYGAERVYYSIHIHSFEKLENANRQLNAQTHRGKVVFWKKTDIPGKGLFYRVYLGRYENRSDAVEFWNKLKESGDVSYFGVHAFKETYKPDKIKITKIPPKKSIKDAVIISPLAGKEERFVDNRDGTITDRTTKLMWVKNGWRTDFFSAVNWEDARKRCETFKHGGYENWRLPTKHEWKSVLDPNREYPALVEPNPFENIIVHMPYWSQTEYIYPSETTAPTKTSPRAYTVMLYYGRMNHQSKNKRAFVMPVRTLEKTP